MMIQLMLIANAGILIQYYDTLLLLDGIQSEGDYPFSKTPPEVLSQMLSNTSKGIFNNIDYLIFSHSHPDHFSPDIVAEYLQHNQVKRLFLPAVTNHRVTKLMQTVNQLNIPFWTFKMERGNTHQYKISKGINLTALCTRHMPQLFDKDLCNCIVLSFQDLNILFLTDCSCKEKEYLKVFQQENIHTVFVNPYFYHDPIGYSILKDYISPKQIVIYHIPFKNDDKIHIRSLVNQDIKKHPKDNVTIFKEPFQPLQIPI